ncbi:hypothetical protein BST27_18920 [Mycobacterium intermedium]|uniref:Uncharacterized protein n=1 Tax=Mycobacterium intermedium TaxID=28445 RepID=A0A1X0FE17_MYCIE|nr:hypothetical protein BST27_18920 [Mycobacterium intermedium]
MADQAGAPTVGSRHTRRRAGEAGAAIAVQDSAGATGLTRHGRVRAVADQRTPEQHHRRGVDGVQYRLFEGL